MRKSLIPRAVARTATTVALAGAVTVPTLGSTPAFASGAGAIAAGQPTAAATSVAPHVWVRDGYFRSREACVRYARQHHYQRYRCERERYRGQWYWHLYYWRGR